MIPEPTVVLPAPSSATIWTTAGPTWLAAAITVDASDSIDTLVPLFAAGAAVAGSSAPVARKAA